MKINLDEIFFKFSPNWIELYVEIFNIASNILFHLLFMMFFYVCNYNSFCFFFLWKSLTFLNIFFIPNIINITSTLSLIEFILLFEWKSHKLFCLKWELKCFNLLGLVHQLQLLFDSKWFYTIEMYTMQKSIYWTFEGWVVKVSTWTP